MQWQNTEGYANFGAQLYKLSEWKYDKNVDLILMTNDTCNTNTHLGYLVPDYLTHFITMQIKVSNRKTRSCNENNVHVPSLN